MVGDCKRVDSMEPPAGSIAWYLTRSRNGFDPAALNLPRMNPIRAQPNRGTRRSSGIRHLGRLLASATKNAVHSESLATLGVVRVHKGQAILPNSLPLEATCRSVANLPAADDGRPARIEFQAFEALCSVLQVISAVMLRIHPTTGSPRLACGKIGWM